MVSHLKFWSHNLHSWCDRIVVLGFSVLFFSQFECKVIHSSHNLVYPSLLVLSLRISHIWRFWLLEDLESSTKKNSGKISSQFLKFLVFRAQFWGSHNGNSQFRSEINSTDAFSRSHEWVNITKQFTTGNTKELKVCCISLFDVTRSNGLLKIYVE